MRSVTKYQDYFSGRRVLLTGSNGFIGANLTRRLLDMGAQVHLVMRPQTKTWRVEAIMSHVQVHKGDITDKSFITQVFDATAPEFVFHLATPRGNDPSDWVRMVETNVVSALNLVEQLERVPMTRMVITGSGLEYGSNAGPHHEQDVLRPTTWHGVGKTASGLIYRQAASSMNLKINYLRLFHVYGPWESSHRLLPKAIRATFDGLPLPLTSSGMPRDWVYVGDVVEALLGAGTTEVQGEVFNVGSGVETSNEGIVDIVEQLTGVAITREVGAYPDSPTSPVHGYANIFKAKDILSWSPEYDLTSGVTAMMEWYQLNPHAWESEAGDKPAYV